MTKPERDNGDVHAGFTQEHSSAVPEDVWRDPFTTKRNVLIGFINWLLSKQTQANHAGGTGRTFRHQTQ
ncbi:hypothetical protein [Glutamicibacter ardleyensis]|uniref:hypothetical protein n=1 Tax=Glutamicibacter ardleyensis TaxID=225894 RepID=UPI003FD135F3